MAYRTGDALLCLETVVGYQAVVMDLSFISGADWTLKSLKRSIVNASTILTDLAKNGFGLAKEAIEEVIDTDNIED